MRILMVGSGAVGQVFGLYLRKAGVELAFYARPDSAARLEHALPDDGLQLYQRKTFQNKSPVHHRLTGYKVVTDVVECKHFNPDQIWFTTPSTVYYTSWFQEFLEAVPAEEVVLFAPEGRRPDFKPESIPEERMVFGGVTFIAWQGALESDEDHLEGINFWLPPLTQIPLEGEKQSADKAADLLRRAGLRTGVKSRNFQEMQAAVTALMSAFVVGFQIAGWSFGAFRRSKWLRFSALGTREAILSQLSEGRMLSIILFKVLTTPVVFHTAAIVLPRLTPFDLEKYLEFHYRKTREQTRNLLEVFISDGEKRGLPVENIRLLYRAFQGSK